MKKKVKYLLPLTSHNQITLLFFLSTKNQGIRTKIKINLTKKTMQN